MTVHSEWGAVDDDIDIAGKTRQWCNLRAELRCQNLCLSRIACIECDLRASHPQPVANGTRRSTSADHRDPRPGPCSSCSCPGPCPGPCPGKLDSRFERGHRARHVGVVTVQLITLDDHCIDCANQSRRLVDPVEMRHDRQLVRYRHTQTTQLPVDAPRRWPDEIANEGIKILDRQWQIDSITIKRRERRVVDPR